MLGLSESGALALAGVQHDAAGHALLGVSVLDGVVDSLHIMAVDLLGIQAEGFRLLGNVAVVQDVGGGAVQLIAVVVDEVDDVVQLVGVCEVERLPDLALVGLAVADDAEHVAVTAIDLVAQSGAGGGGGALAQRAGGQIHAGGQLPVGVAGELGVRMVEGISFLHGIVAHQAKSGVSHGARVALGQDQPIPILPPGVLRVKLHNLSVQDGHQVRQVHGAAHVAEAPGVDDLQRFQPDLSRQNFALFFVHGVFLPFLHLNCTPRGNLRRIGSTGGQVAEK